MTRTASGRRDALRTFNKHVLNPAMLLLAGRRYWYAAALHHIGRRSGRAYTTPIVAQPVAGGGFVIPLPYGTGVDWLRNIRAAGQANIDVHGHHYVITDPRIADAQEAFPLIPARLQRTWRRFGIEQYLLVRTVSGGEQT
ncbi:nitroreductase family deazaflavin-dependent oxidoreductase [Actinoplanes sp. NPDC049599]|uniref:nitroreductase family deazaflavin-dependent oxidoreductase n=1 Tax=Actinoplanes sp. NPDC049599 TaxID=3363903 RepID=UPI0037A81170